MPEEAGDFDVLKKMTDLNVKTIIDLILTNAVANQQAVLSEQLANTQAMNNVRLSSVGQITNRMNSVDPLEASAVSRVHRTPSGDSGTDAATIVALAQQLMKGAQTTPPVTAPAAAA